MRAKSARWGEVVADEPKSSWSEEPSRVIPGRAEGANPEVHSPQHSSIGTGLWIPALAALGRIDVENSPCLPVIHGVRPHVGGRRHAVAHVVEARDRGNIPDVAFGEASLT